MPGLTGEQVVRIKLKYVYRDVDRHGNVRVYFWRGKGHPKHRFEEEPGTDAFLDRYRKLNSSGPVALEERQSAIRHGTWRWLCTEYFASTTYKLLDASTKRTRRRVLESTFTEQVYPGSKETFADFPLSRMRTKYLRVLRDRKADLPGSASDRVKAIRAVYKWGFAEEHVASNPARELSKLQLNRSGWHSWTPEEVEQFEKVHPIGTKARLALALLLWSGVRRSDVVRLGKQHVRDSWLKFTQFKNRNRNPVVVEIPILPELQRVIDASPRGDLHFLVTKEGRPYTAAGFGNQFREWCVEAKVPGRAHGIRKAGAATAAENGASTQQLMAIYGWITLAEAERYTRAAQRKRMAKDAMGTLVRRE